MRSLTPAQWELPTLARQWTVKDVAAHLLDGNVRTISMLRDGYLLKPGQPVQSYRELVDYLNGLNADWVNAARRMSPGLLTDWLEQSGPACRAELEKLDPWADAVFAVSWAGEERSANWFHIARDYTERFHHQMQIRHAVGAPGLFEPELYHPFIATLLRGLPHAYRNVSARNGTLVCVNITGDAGGNWFLQRGEERWALIEDPGIRSASMVTLDPDTAWRLFTKGITPELARSAVQVTGDESLALPALSMVAVMA